MPAIELLLFHFFFILKSFHGYWSCFRDATDKLESARCLTNEAIQIIQDKICTATNEDVKNNLWVEHVSDPFNDVVEYNKYILAIKISSIIK